MNLLIDPETATAAEYTISLRADGQNSISSTSDFDQTFTSTTGTLTLAVPDPVLRDDVNLDRMVTFSDISPFIAILSAGGFQVEADINGDGEVNFSDISRSLRS